MCSLSFNTLEVNVPGRQPAFELAIVLDQVIVLTAGDPQQLDLRGLLLIEVGEA
jgi:hypothetical protein